MSVEFSIGYGLGVLIGVWCAIDFQRRRRRQNTLVVDEWLSRVRRRG